MYSYIDLTFKKLAPLCGKSTGKWHEASEFFVYWPQIKKSSSLGNRQENDTNQTAYSYTDLKLEKSAPESGKRQEYETYQKMYSYIDLGLRKIGLSFCEIDRKMTRISRRIDLLILMS